MATIPEHTRPRPDEGYSEGPDTLQESDGHMQLDDSDIDDAGPGNQPMLVAFDGPKRADDISSFLSSLSGSERAKVFVQVGESLEPEQKHDLLTSALGSLPTSILAQIFESLRYRLHINPADKLPAELVETVMMNLEPLEVIRCSMMSNRWRMMALDLPLWKAMYLREGWMVDGDAIQARLASDNGRIEDSPRSHRRKYEASADARGSRKRQREAGQARTTASEIREMEAWDAQHDRPEADDDNEMEGVETSTVGRSTLADTAGLANLSPLSSSPDTPYDGPALREDVLEHHRNTFEFSPPLSPPVSIGAPGHKSINWHYLYKQRRRLESNWNEGRYKNFQLPHPSYPDEMHEECVYTIQFIKDYLVSGSRDKSIKVWNLDTQRCERTLQGQHDQSVLCLQFDPSPDENIIVSGGSDSYVVIWNFATGQVINKMTKAHTDSVLNLRFDHRYLITCSKDMTIKIWNRRRIRSDDPIVPEMLWREYPPEERKFIEPYSPLGTLTGHGAAVNAIQIYGDTVVSASGDRTVRMWNIKTGQCIREISGHVKGIACVQFDGRRIVSGSSDNTVRIFDAATKGEVACLHGHSHLVRTLQARFGDRQVTDEELEELAKQTQDNMLRRLEDMQRRPGGLSGRNVLDSVHGVRSLNTKIPHGGGGTRWGRIVSGSYDETVIIWKKDSDGKWIASRRLHQDDVFAAQRNRANRPARGQVAPGAGHGQGQGHGQQQQQQQQQQQNMGLQQGQAQVQPQPQQQGQMPAPAAPLAQGQASAQGLAAGPAQPRAPPGQHAHHHHHHAPPPGGQGGANNPQLPRQHRRAQAMWRVNPEESSNRVFKLQFDTRRIVCCSQNKTIVGWDFANGDEDLEVASKFFAETD